MLAVVFGCGYTGTDTNVDGDLENYLLLADGSGGFIVSVLPGGKANTVGVAIAQMTDFADGHLDIVFANQHSDNVLLLGDGSGGFANVVSLPSNPAFQAGAGGGTSAVAVADVDNDGKNDIVFTSSWKGGISSSNLLLVGDGQGGFDAQYLAGGSRNSRAVAIADITRDGFLDILIGNTGGANQLLVNDGEGSFTESDLEGKDGEAIAVGDMTGDGRLEICMGNDANAVNFLLIGDMVGTFKATDLYGGARYTKAVAVADVTGAVP